VGLQYYSSFWHSKVGYATLLIIAALVVQIRRNFAYMVALLLSGYVLYDFGGFLLGRRFYTVVPFSEIPNFWRELYVTRSAGGLVVDGMLIGLAVLIICYGSIRLARYAFSKIGAGPLAT